MDNVSNITLGVFTIALAAIGYFMAFRLQQKQKFQFALFLLVASGLILRLYCASDLFLHTWDERYHALVAKNLIDHPLVPTLYDNPVLPYSIKNWGGNHIWVHKQPIPLWSMALSMAIFGINEIALRLPSLLISTLGIVVAYSIAKNLYSRKVAFIAAFLFSIHGLIIELTAGRVATDHIDLFFLFFIELAVLLAIKFARTKSHLLNLLCGVSIGLAILSKWLPALIVLPVWGLLVLQTKKFTVAEIFKYGLLLCLAIVVIALPWQVYIHLQFPEETQWENHHNTLHITEVLDKQGGPFYYHFDKMRMLFGELIYLPMLWFLYKGIKRPFNYTRALLLIWILVPFLFFSFVATKMQGYTVFTAPAIFIVTAVFWVYLKRYISKFRYRWMVQLVLFLVLALPVRYSIERIKPFDHRDRNPEWARELKALNIDDPKTILFNTRHPIEAMFYNNCVAYEHTPEPKVLERLKAMGYTIIILEE